MATLLPQNTHTRHEQIAEPIYLPHCGTHSGEKITLICLDSTCQSYLQPLCAVCQENHAPHSSLQHLKSAKKVLQRVKSVIAYQSEHNYPSNDSTLGKLTALSLEFTRIAEKCQEASESIENNILNFYSTTALQQCQALTIQRLQRAQREYLLLPSSQQLKIFLQKYFATVQHLSVSGNISLTTNLSKPEQYVSNGVQKVQYTTNTISQETEERATKYLNKISQLLNILQRQVSLTLNHISDIDKIYVEDSEDLGGADHQPKKLVRNMSFGPANENETRITADAQVLVNDESEGQTQPSTSFLFSQEDSVIRTGDILQDSQTSSAKSLTQSIQAAETISQDARTSVKDSVSADTHFSTEQIEQKTQQNQSQSTGTVVKNIAFEDAQRQQILTGETLYFVKSQYKDSQLMNELVPGKSFQGTFKSQLVYTQQSFTSGVHTVKMKIEGIKFGQTGFVYVGALKSENDFEKHFMQAEWGCHRCLFRENNSQMGIIRGSDDNGKTQDSFKDLIQEGDVVTLVLDLDRGVFEVLPPRGERKLVSVPKDFTFFGSAWRIAVCLTFNKHRITFVD